MQRKEKSNALKEKNLVVLCTTSPTNYELNQSLWSLSIINMVWCICYILEMPNGPNICMYRFVCHNRYCLRASLRSMSENKRGLRIGVWPTPTQLRPREDCGLGAWPTLMWLTQTLVWWFLIWSFLVWDFTDKGLYKQIIDIIVCKIYT